jgi:4'-phosphopantetheinyl transferase
VRCVLSRYCPQPARDWGFGKTVHGRPVILSPSENARQLSFNISHCAGMVLVGVARGGRLGVDTESLVRGDDFVAIGRCCFAADEVSVLESLPDELRRWRYASYWTLKEAYVKATGLGLTIPLNSFGFRMPTDEQIDPWFDEQVENTADLHFSLFRPCASHVAAVCCQVASGVMPQLQMRNMVPLASERLIDCALLARSAMACVDGSGVKSVLP